MVVFGIPELVGGLDLRLDRLAICRPERLWIHTHHGLGFKVATRAPGFTRITVWGLRFMVQC